MPIPLDASGFASEDDAHGNGRPKPGMYHARIVEIDDSFEKFDKVIVEFKMLAGTVPGQEGLSTREFFATTQAAQPRLTLFALVTGLIKPGEKKEVEFSDAIGKEVIIKLDERKGNDGKTYCNLTYDGMWSLENPAVAGVPRAADDGDADAADDFQPVEAATATEGGVSGGDDWDNI